MKILAKTMLGVLALLVSATACKKEQPVQAPPAAAPSDAIHGGMPGMGMPAKKESTVVVPDTLKGRWKSVRIVVLETATRKEIPCVVPVGSDFKVPGTDLTLRVENLLPDFSMGGGVITSKSDKLENPAVQVRILEGGKETFKGWMFAKFPDAHPFEHPKYSARLIEFLP